MEPRDLSEHVPYEPGKGTEEVARELGLSPDELVKLASNENPHGASPEAVRAVADNAEKVSVYPTAGHADLTERLARKWSLAREQVWLTPGADGAIDYLSRAMLEPGDSILTPTPGFAYYPMAARYVHGEVSEYELSKADDFVLSADVVLEAYDGERIVYVTTPHNPTGAEMSREDVVTLLESVADHTLVVVDEAYAEFTEVPPSVELLDEYDNLAVLRTFSKAYGLAGLRLGYACVPEAWGETYARVNTPFSVSELALRAGLAAMDDVEHVERSVESARWARAYLRENLAARTWESGGNFVLCDVGDGTTVAQRAREEGVIVRDCSSFGLPECVRITCGTESETRRAVEVLNGVLDEEETP